MFEVRELAKKDYKRAIDFAIKGMHFDFYTKNKPLLKIYGRHLLYKDLQKATDVIALYEGENLAGVIIAEMKGCKRKFKSTFRSAYASFVGKCINTFFKNAEERYELVKRQMLNNILDAVHVDGEILFLVANPAPRFQHHGIGSILLEELAKIHNGKNIYLFTNSKCNYHFYDKKGFVRADDQVIKTKSKNSTKQVTAMIYTKKLV